MSQRHELEALVDSWVTVPALAHDRHLTTVAANPLARLLMQVAPGTNLVRSAFANTPEPDDSDDWRTVVEDVASNLRAAVGRFDEDGEFLRIIGELASTDAVFVDAWSKTGPLRTSGRHRYVHDAVGAMVLEYQLMVIPGDGEHIIIVWRAVDASARDALRQLAELTRLS